MRTIRTGAATINEIHGSSIEGVRAALNHALRGKAEVVEHVLACLLARGHLLVEDLPGLGKTTLAKALAQVIGGDFARENKAGQGKTKRDIARLAIFSGKTKGDIGRLAIFSAGDASMIPTQADWLSP